jgi:thiamine transport system permease protein
VTGRRGGGDRAAIAGRVGWAAAAALPVSFVAVFFAWPVGAIVGRGLDAGAFTAVLGDPRLRSVVWFTVWQAAVSTGLTVAAGLPVAAVLARFRFPGRRLVWALVAVPFVLPTVVVGTAFLALDVRRSVTAIVLAHVFFNLAVVVRTVGGLWSHLDPSLGEVARSLGAGRWRAFREVTLPLLAPAIGSAALIVFLFCSTSFGVVLLLGGPTLGTVEVEIWRATAERLDLGTASALALVQLAAVVAMLVAYGRLADRRAVEQPLLAEADVARRPRGPAQWAAVVAAVGGLAVFLGTPLAVLVERSLALPGGGHGFEAYRALGDAGQSFLVPPIEAVRNSLGFAAVATAIALVVGGLAAAVVAGRRSGPARAVDTLLMLPLGTSAVTLGFGFLVALDRPPLDLRGSPALIPIAHALVAVPFVVRTLVPVLRSIDSRLREAAAVLGASPWRARREVDLPLVGRALLVAAGFAFAVSLGEFGATVFLARPDVPTLPIAVQRLLRPGLPYREALAMSTILLVVTAGVILAVDRVRVGRVGEF